MHRQIQLPFVMLEVLPHRFIERVKLFFLLLDEIFFHPLGKGLLMWIKEDFTLTCQCLHDKAQSHLIWFSLLGVGVPVFRAGHAGRQSQP